MVSSLGGTAFSTSSFMRLSRYGLMFCWSFDTSSACCERTKTHQVTMSYCQNNNNNNNKNAYQETYKYIHNEYDTAERKRGRGRLSFVSDPPSPFPAPLLCRSAITRRSHARFSSSHLKVAVFLSKSSLVLELRLVHQGKERPQLL